MPGFKTDNRKEFIKKNIQPEGGKVQILENYI
jgi:hypothetical protein